MRATRRPAIRGLFSVVVSFSPVAAVSPGAPFGQIGIGFKASRVDAAGDKHAATVSRQSNNTVRMTCHCLAPRAARKERLRDSLSD
jgi:hypothetical protein